MSAAALQLTEPYEPTAVYYELSDSAEFLQSLRPRYQRRIDERLTLVHAMDDDAVIGFRLKGFKNFYLTELKPVCDRLSIEFIELTKAFEKVVERLNDVDDEQERLAAYRQAYELAKDSRARLTSLELAA